MTRLRKLMRGVVMTAVVKRRRAGSPVKKDILFRRSWALVRRGTKRGSK